MSFAAAGPVASGLPLPVVVVAAAAVIEPRSPWLPGVAAALAPQRGDAATASTAATATATRQRRCSYCEQNRAVV